MRHYKGLSFKYFYKLNNYFEWGVQMISGHLCEKRGYYYAVHNLYDENGKTKKEVVFHRAKIKAIKTRGKNSNGFAYSVLQHGKGL